MQGAEGMWQNRIEQNRNIMLGKPVVRGTRLSVEQILEDLSHGSSKEDLLQAYPFLAPEDIDAALAFAAASLSAERTIFLEDRTG
jgi:uncharacterized protein (DUF433 family)